MLAVAAQLQHPAAVCPVWDAGVLHIRFERPTTDFASGIHRYECQPTSESNGTNPLGWYASREEKTSGGIEDAIRDSMENVRIKVRTTNGLRGQALIQERFECRGLRGFTHGESFTIRHPAFIEDPRIVKRNMDLIREILLRLEAADFLSKEFELSLPNYRESSTWIDSAPAEQYRNSLGAYVSRGI